MNFPVNAPGVRFVVLRGVTRVLFEASALGALVGPVAEPALGGYPGRGRAVPRLRRLGAQVHDLVGL